MRRDTVSKTKPKTGTASLTELATTKKPLRIGEVILSSLASVTSFVPYIAIYLIMPYRLWVPPIY